MCSFVLIYSSSVIRLFRGIKFLNMGEQNSRINAQLPYLPRLTRQHPYCYFPFTLVCAYHPFILGHFLRNQIFDEPPSPFQYLRNHAPLFNASFELGCAFHTFVWTLALPDVSHFECAPFTLKIVYISRHAQWFSGNRYKPA